MPYFKCTFRVNSPNKHKISRYKVSSRHVTRRTDQLRLYKIDKFHLSKIKSHRFDSSSIFPDISILSHKPSLIRPSSSVQSTTPLIPHVPIALDVDQLREPHRFLPDFINQLEAAGYFSNDITSVSTTPTHHEEPQQRQDDVLLSTCAKQTSFDGEIQGNYTHQIPSIDGDSSTEHGDVTDSEQELSSYSSYIDENDDENDDDDDYDDYDDDDDLDDDLDDNDDDCSNAYYNEHCRHSYYVEFSLSDDDGEGCDDNGGISDDQEYVDANISGTYQQHQQHQHHQHQPEDSSPVIATPLDPGPSTIHPNTLTDGDAQACPAPTDSDDDSTNNNNNNNNDDDVASPEYEHTQHTQQQQQQQQQPHGSQPSPGHSVQPPQISAFSLETLHDIKQYIAPYSILIFDLDDTVLAHQPKLQQCLLFSQCSLGEKILLEALNTIPSSSSSLSSSSITQSSPEDSTIIPNSFKDYPPLSLHQKQSILNAYSSLRKTMVLSEPGIHQLIDTLSREKHVQIFALTARSQNLIKITEKQLLDDNNLDFNDYCPSMLHNTNESITFIPPPFTATTGLSNDIPPGDNNDQSPDTMQSSQSITYMVKNGVVYCNNNNKAKVIQDLFIRGVFHTTTSPSTSSLPSHDQYPIKDQLVSCNTPELLSAPSHIPSITHPSQLWVVDDQIGVIYQIHNELSIYSNHPSITLPYLSNHHYTIPVVVSCHYTLNITQCKHTTNYLTYIHDQDASSQKDSHGNHSSNQHSKQSPSPSSPASRIDPVKQLTTITQEDIVRFQVYHFLYNKCQIVNDIDGILALTGVKIPAFPYPPILNESSLRNNTGNHHDKTSHDNDHHKQQQKHQQKHQQQQQRKTRQEDRCHTEDKKSYPPQAPKA